MQAQHQHQELFAHVSQLKPRWSHECGGMHVILPVKIQQCHCGATLHQSRAVRVPVVDDPVLV